MAVKIPRKGEVWTIDLGQGKKHESQGIRPCVVISEAILNKVGFAIVIPIQEKLHPLESHVLIQGKEGESLNVSGYGITENLRGINCDRLGRKVGCVNKYTLKNLLIQSQRLILSEDCLSSAPKKKNFKKKH